MQGRRGGRWSLEGVTALVTGGSRGIGHAVVEELAGLGALVHMCSCSKADLDRCLHEWEAKGFHMSGSMCDVSSRSERERLMEKVASIFYGKLNILLLNESFMEAVRAKTPLRRMGEVEAVSSMVAFSFACLLLHTSPGRFLSLMEGPLSMLSTQPMTRNMTWVGNRNMAFLAIGRTSLGQSTLLSGFQMSQ